ncbi:MAG: hypothetical protein GVY17_03105 [Cyanobacteria bacterium]|nr:hypothetical protein [Cyanobacteria bacterium GSL.Bin21]
MSERIYQTRTNVVLPDDLLETVEKRVIKKSFPKISIDDGDSRKLILSVRELKQKLGSLGEDLNSQRVKEWCVKAGYQPNVFDLDEKGLVALLKAVEKASNS